MRKYFFFSPIGLLLLTTCILPEAAAQTYFKEVVESDLYFNQQLARFPNGDILVGDSFLGPLQNGGENGKVVMARMDDCGNKRWAYSYSLPSGYLEVRDFIISSTEEILAYGSYFNGLKEVLFLLRVNGQTGQTAAFRLYDPETSNGYFAYSLNAVERQFMVYGLLVNPNTGFMAYFDEALLPLWAKKISPFDPNGAAIIGRDKSMVARAGSYVFKMNEKGDFEWDWRLNIPAVNGPVQTATGYIYVGHLGGFSFFFEMDTRGQLLWQSDMFAAVESSGAMTLLADGNVLFTYNCPDATHNGLCQITLSPNGRIAEQRRLQLAKTLNSGKLSQSIHDNTLTLAGNVNAFVTGNAEVKDFLLQFPLDQLTDECMNWERFQGTVPNSIQLELDSARLEARDFDLKMIERSSAAIDSFLYPLTELCDSSATPVVQSQQKVLPCEEDWRVSLPDDSYSWLDGSLDDPRILELPGIYKAQNDDCADPITLEFRLEKEGCGCAVYFPTAFSPNGDGFNEELVFVSACNLDAVTTKVFNRFGELIFTSHSIDQYWDGTYRQQHVVSGVYAVVVEYQWTDAAGRQQRGLINRAVTLIR